MDVGLADGKSGWIGGTKQHSTAGGNGCQRKMIHGTQARRANLGHAGRGLPGGKCPEIGDAIRQKMGDCWATLEKH